MAAAVVARTTGGPVNTPEDPVFFSQADPLVMATPFLVAGVVSVFALPRGTEERAREGEAARMGRVDGWMNPPRNEWLREDTREVGDGNARRFWKTGRVTAAARRAGGA